MILLIILGNLVGILLGFLGVYLGWEIAEILSAEALNIAVFGAILNYLYTQRTFGATNYPIPLIRLYQSANFNKKIIRITNPHQSILISEVRLSVFIKPRRSNPKWLRHKGQIELCKFLVEVINPNQIQEAGDTPDLDDVMNTYYPNVLQKTIVNEREQYKVDEEYTFDFIVEISYRPHIHGGKKQQKTYKGCLTPIRDSDSFLEAWEVDILQYPQHPSTTTSIG